MSIFISPFSNQYLVGAIKDPITVFSAKWVWKTAQRIRQREIQRSRNVANAGGVTTQGRRIEKFFQMTSRRNMKTALKKLLSRSVAGLNTVEFREPWAKHRRYDRRMEILSKNFHQACSKIYWMLLARYGEQATSEELAQNIRD